MIRMTRWLVGVSAVLTASACNSECDEAEADPKAIAAESKEYVVFAWNDLGMHCLNPSYDTAVLLPPYNNLVAQVVRRGNPPTIVTDGVNVSYRLIDNTTSMGKTDAYGGDYSQFWTNANALFGATLAEDTGLNLVDPSLHNGLSGSTRATVPTSDEINCAKCHAEGGEATEEIGGGTNDVFVNILALHDVSSGTSLVSQTPVLCANCHGSPALGQTGPGPNGYLSQVIHSKHAEEGDGITCYHCHPGATTKCNRSTAHTASDGNCTTCHGSLAKVGNSIAEGKRIPWVDEPKCVTCHEGVGEVDTGDTLYRHASGHGRVYCAACHGSPHAQVPSEQAKDEFQTKQYQSVAVPIGSCAVCHASSRGEGADEFGEEHGGSSGRASACHVCHTIVPSSLSSGPHHFEWKAR